MERDLYEMEKRQSNQQVPFSFPKERRIFHTYLLEDIITINSCENATITYTHSSIPDTFCTIDTRAMVMTLLNTTYKIQYLNKIQLPFTEIYIWEQYILIQSSPLLKIHLQRYTPLTTKTQLLYLPIKQIVQNYVPAYNNTFTNRYTFQKITQIPYEQRPLFLTIAPTLFMSIASLLTGSIIAYQSYIQGNSFYQLLPSLLLPSTMLISTLLIYPLSHLYDKNVKTKKQVEDINKEQEYIQTYIASFQTFIQEFLEYTDTYYPCCSNLLHSIIHHAIQPLHAKKDGISLRLGMKKNVFSIQETKQEVLDLLQPLYDKPYPWIIQMQQYHHIAILDNKNSIAFLQYVLLQYAYYYDYVLLIGCSKPFLQDFQFVKQLPNTMHSKKRYITDDASTLVSWCEMFKNTTYLVCTIHMPINVDAVAHSISIVNENEQYHCDLTIDLLHQSAFDHQTCQQFDVIYDIQPMKNINLFLFCLRRNENRVGSYENDFFSMHHIHDIQPSTIYEGWNKNSIQNDLKAILGVDEKQHPMILDLQQTKDGPHGLIAGMTGSGKSELLLSMITSIALRYSFEDVQFALLDFKGGGIGSVLQPLPHVIGTLSNLDTTHMQRALIAFEKECEQRQLLFQNMQAKYNTPILDIQTYRKYAKQDDQKIADLLIVVDEFAELKRQQPEFLDQLISISRIGRSLGMHLILSTQKPSGIVSEEIWANCSFRIALKVAQENDSKEVLHTNAAFYLRQAGEFILQTQSKNEKGLATYANAPCIPIEDDIQLIEADGSQTYISLHQAKKQIEVIISAFKQMQKSLQPLWFSPLKQMLFTIGMPKGVFAKVDDFYQRKQYDISLFQNRNIVFVCMDQHEKEKLLHTLLYTCMQSLQQEDALYVIDDEMFGLQKIYEAYLPMNALFSSSHQEKTENLFKSLQQQTKYEKVLLITNTARFLQIHENNGARLLDVLENANLYHTYVILCMSTYHTLSYSQQLRIHDKYVLKTDNIQEIQYVFETSEKLVANDEESGICKKEHLLPFRYYFISFSNLLSSIPTFSTTQKLHPILSMPQKIKRTHSTKEIQIGISYTTYQWVTLAMHESLYVVSMYKHEWYAYYKAMEYYCKCSTRSDEEDDSHLIFLSIDEYKQQHENYPVLYVGASFSMQYIWLSKIRSLNENEAILFTDYTNEKLKIL